MIDRPFRTVGETAVLVGVHVNTIKRIPPSELPYAVVSHRGDRRYRIEDVRAYIEARTMGRSGERPDLAPVPSGSTTERVIRTWRDGAERDEAEIVRLKAALDQQIIKLEAFAAGREHDVTINRDPPDNINTAVAAVCRGWASALRTALDGPVVSREVDRAVPGVDDRLGVQLDVTVLSVENHGHGPEIKVQAQWEGTTPDKPGWPRTSFWGYNRPDPRQFSIELDEIAHSRGPMYARSTWSNENKARVEIERLRGALTQIANADYRGNRSHESEIAYRALEVKL